MEKENFEFSFKEKENLDGLLTTIKINLDFLFLVDKMKKNDTETVEKLLNKLDDKYNGKMSSQYGKNLEEYYFFNHYQVMTSLLAFLVLPREFLGNKLSKDSKEQKKDTEYKLLDNNLSELPAEWSNVVLNSFKYIKDKNSPINKNEVRLIDYIACLRNAVSHNSIKIIEKSEIKYWIFAVSKDEYIELEEKSLIDFILIFIDWFLNIKEKKL